MYAQNKFFACQNCGLVAKHFFCRLIKQRLLINPKRPCDPVFPVCTLSQIPQDTVLEIWKGKGYQAELSKMTKAGHRVLLSAPWYINHISYGQDWRMSYAVQPQNFSGVWSSMLGWGRKANGRLIRTWCRFLVQIQLILMYGLVVKFI